LIRTPVIVRDSWLSINLVPEAVVWCPDQEQGEEQDPQIGRRALEHV
jgi:hypothetical protein